jgi:hypothetical protein
MGHRRAIKRSRQKATSQKADAGWVPTEFGKLAFFNDAPYFSEVLIQLLAVPDACARPKVSRMAATKLP